MTDTETVKKVAEAMAAKRGLMMERRALEKEFPDAQ